MIVRQFMRKDAMRFGLAAAAVAANLVAAGCGGIVDPSQNQTETFSGTVNVAGISPVHTFNVSKSGEYFITITKLDPPLTPANATVQVVFGQAAGGSCNPIQTNAFARLGQALSGSIFAGSYCVVIVDVGFLTTTESYTLQVQHP